MADPVPSAPPEADPGLSRWHGDGLIARSARFTLTVMAPLSVAMVLGADLWIAYALITCILGYMLDTGGPALQRLGCFAVAGAVVLAGTGLGTLVAASIVLTTLVLAATGALYGLLESVHQSAAFATRFLCMTTALAALNVPLERADVAVVAAFALYAWLVSILWDLAVRAWRPSTAPRLAEVAAYLRATRLERGVFALEVGATVAVAFLTGRALGLQHPHWTVLAVVIALRADSQLSRRMTAQLILGTLIGVSAAFVYEMFFTSPSALMVGMAIAALVRWPGQQLHGALGLAAMAAFVILLLQVIAIVTHVPSHAVVERVVDMALGCAFAMTALCVNYRAHEWLGRRRAAGQPAGADGSA